MNKMIPDEVMKLDGLTDFQKLIAARLIIASRLIQNKQGKRVVIPSQKIADIFNVSEEKIHFEAGFIVSYEELGIDYDAFIRSFIVK